MPENANFWDATRRLCVQRERPRRGRATEQCDELAPSHVTLRERALRNPETIAASNRRASGKWSRNWCRKLISLHVRDGSKQTSSSECLISAFPSTAVICQGDS